jgi:hypothetical protein
MEAQELHRGRLIDHIQLVVADLGASRRFYVALFQVLQIPLYNSGDTNSGDTIPNLWRQGGRNGKSMTVIKGSTAQIYYHGTRAQLSPGDLIEPGFSSN